MNAYFKLSRSGPQFHFVLRAPNHRTILSSERYTTQAAALKGIEAVRRSAVAERGIVRTLARNGEPMFNVVAKNGEIVGTSETYRTAASREKGIASVVLNAPQAPLRHPVD
ncbi:YegP family protein [Stenotrophomonas sp. HITSZ_GD]|uniref:YegP family protein n=1 Tax=Stenotrophomonas sp. HITSZ_GD TaxID=3037248 RepID=UPI00240DA55B|nr:YegP family protein [Stenotrophomonas sp. HITSZ_GD]MDG2525154.1 YegP family protein [Stenotrophomonas sp. HITSZ_GD]